MSVFLPSRITRVVRLLVGVVFFLAGPVPSLARPNPSEGGLFSKRPAASVLPLPGNSTPHPSVVRIVVDEGGQTQSLGSGTLVDQRDDYGLVLTNWHVVRDAKGNITVIFPDGFSSLARVRKVDSDWDLAALIIWRPRVPPVSLASYTPKPGELLTIAGYGSGNYRAATGRCTQYVSPGVRFPPEMVELSAEARQGDSGGPIFNERGEMAGVLFGASRGSTTGSHVGRVRTFLASVVPPRDNSTTPITPRGAPLPVASSGTPAPNSVGRAAAHASPLIPLPVPADERAMANAAVPPAASPATGGMSHTDLSATGFDDRGPESVAHASPLNPDRRFSADSDSRRQPETWTSSSFPRDPARQERETAHNSAATSLVSNSLFEHAKSIFALIGFFAVVLRLFRAGESSNSGSSKKEAKGVG